MKFSLFKCALLLFTIFHIIQADIPVHCLKSQVRLYTINLTLMHP